MAAWQKITAELDEGSVEKWLHTGLIRGVHAWSIVRDNAGKIQDFYLTVSDYAFEKHIDDNPLFELRAKMERASGYVINIINWKTLSQKSWDAIFKKIDSFQPLHAELLMSLSDALGLKYCLFVTRRYRQFEMIQVVKTKEDEFKTAFHAGDQAECHRLFSCLSGEPDGVHIIDIDLSVSIDVYLKVACAFRDKNKQLEKARRKSALSFASASPDSPSQVALFPSGGA